MVGMFGPYTSPSRMPTFAPDRMSAQARFTATVDLPTPPLPEETAIVFLTPGMGFLGGSPPGWAIVLDAENPVLFKNRGLSRYALADFRGALADFDSALELRPGYADALASRALSRSALGDPQGARRGGWQEPCGRMVAPGSGLGTCLKRSTSCSFPTC